MGVQTVARPCAFVFLRSGERLVVSEMIDEIEGTFYRPPGGGIEFGEHSRDAAVRELHEEFGLELDPGSLTLLGVIENRFEFRGAPGHEICFIYEAHVDDAVVERLDGLPVRDLPPPDLSIAKVFSVAELSVMSPVYPDGVQGLLTDQYQPGSAMEA